MSAAKCFLMFPYDDVNASFETNKTRLCSCSGNATKFHVRAHSKKISRQAEYCTFVDVAIELLINVLEIISSSSNE